MQWTRFGTLSAMVLLPLTQLGGSCGPTTTLEPGVIRFKLNVAGGAQAPMYVQVTTEDDQPGWIRVAHANGQRVYLRERCEIADCGKPPAVCGAAIPIIRDIAPAGSIELSWDGRESALDPASGCETRQPAPAGSYKATFCYARQASLPGGGDPAVGTQGSLEQPVCKDVPFSLPDAKEVKYQIPSRTGD